MSPGSLCTFSSEKREKNESGKAFAALLASLLFRRIRELSSKGEEQPKAKTFLMKLICAVAAFDGAGRQRDAKTIFQIQVFPNTAFDCLRTNYKRSCSAICLVSLIK